MLACEISREAEPLTPGCRVEVPAISGFGGNLVVLMPNGLTAFRFSDGGDFNITPMVRAVDAIRPLCR